MNVRITPRAEPQRTDTYTGVTKCHADGATLTLYFGGASPVSLPMRSVAEIAIDENGAVT